MISRIDPKKEVKLVSTYDDAIDLEKSEYIVDEDQSEFQGKEVKVLKYTKTLDIKDLVLR